MYNRQSLLGTIRLDVSFEILKDYLTYIFLYNYHLIIIFCMKAYDFSRNR